MKLDRVPPRILLALGLGACGPGDDGDTDGSTESYADAEDAEGSVGPCLSQPDPTYSTADDDGTSTPGDDTLGPCLGQLPTTGGVDTGGSDSGGTDSGGTGTGTGTGTDSGGTDSDGTDTGGETVGPCLAPPPDPPDAPAPEGPGGVATAPASPRAAVLDRVLSSGRLPADVAARLRARK